MRSVAAWAQFHIDHPTAMPSDSRARLVDAAGVAVMFCRPFLRDDKGMNLDADEFRSRLADGANQVMFDRLRLRRSKVLAHADTAAGVINVTETYKMFARRDPDDPLDLRAYNVGADDGILGPDDLGVIADLAKELADFFSNDMVALGAQRVRELA